MRRLTLKAKIFLWFGIIILIAVLLYGFLIYVIYQFNLRGERYLNDLKENPHLDPSFVESLKESEMKNEFFRPPPIKVLPQELFMRVFFIITGGVVAIILLSATGGFILLRRTLNQVDLITANVKEIDEKGLHLRLRLKGKDPISNMANTFDSMLDKIEKAFNSQKQFIQNVSHELNTPLTVMKTKIDVLKQKKNVTKERYREVLELIDGEIMRLSGITGELLVLSDLDSNDHKTGEIDLREILERILKLYENQIETKGIKIIKHIGQISRINGNRIQVEQLIFNLLDNAVKYSNPGGNMRIDIKRNTAKKSIDLKISNTTTAIIIEDVPHIFDRFFKGNKMYKKGFGLGLSIAQKIAEKHNGTLEASFDKKKKEITFLLRLPFASN